MTMMVTDDGADNDADYYDAGVHNNNANGEYDDDRWWWKKYEIWSRLSV